MGKIKSISSIFGLFAFASLLFVAPVKAQQQIQILHRPIGAENLPHPGNPISLLATLTGTGSVNLDVRALVVSDGRFVEVPFKKSFLDEYDRPVYQFDFVAPLTDMSYRFILKTSGDKIISSPRYEIRRKCVPKISLASFAAPKNPTEEERIKKLVREATFLEKDIRNYEAAVKLIEELQTIIIPNKKTEK
ncbi:MAG: hypothetical protein D6719_00445 [Candidatus Dadabacteria bacterium]|nr:MAG: hypothetical protein D6719_00445 [Candidatus Dadabacteria bacterium]